MPIIFPRCGPHNAENYQRSWATTRKKRTNKTEITAVFCVVAYNAEKLSALQATTWNIFPLCGQQRRKMFGVVGNNVEELPQCRTF
jgi:hypothetical protein